MGAFDRLRPLKFATTQMGTPWDTFVLLALWAYCGMRVVVAHRSTLGSQSWGAVEKTA